MSKQLPQGWNAVKLRDLARDISYGFTASASDKADGPRMLRITDIQNNRVNWATVPRCECDEPTKYLLSAGDIVIARTGATTGKSFLLRKVPEPSVFASYLIRVQPSDAVAPEYLANYMLSPTYWEQITVVSKGTAQPGANASILGALDVPLPPLNEQHRIVTKLEALQTRSRRAREALDAVPPLLEKLRQSILAAAFRGDLTKDWRAENKDVEPASKLLDRIRAERRKKWEESELAKMKAKGKPPVDDKWKAKYKEREPAQTTGLPELPAGWCWARVDELLFSPEDLFDGPFGSELKTADYTESGVRVVRLENVASIHFAGDKETFISEEKFGQLTRHSVSAGDVIFGSFIEETTRVCLLPDLGGPAIAKADCFCIRPAASVMRADLLVYALGGPNTRNRLTRGIHGATRPRINTSQLRNVPVAVPPASEQVAIVDVIELALAHVQTLAAACGDVATSCKLLDRAVLAKAFRGELVPQDPNDEPAPRRLPRMAAENGVANAAPDAGAATSRTPRRGRPKEAVEA